MVAQEFFSCMICLDPATDAVESLCCHQVFCELCSKECQRCPNCRNIHFTVTESFAIRQFLGNLQIPCTNTGCIDMTTRSNIQDHLKVCNYSFVNCDLCHINVIRKDLEDHSKICPYALIPCKNNGCSNVSHRKDVQDHLRDCKHEVLKCPNDGCNYRLKRMEIGLHRSMRCRYESIKCSNEGCHEEIMRHQMKDHQEKSCKYKIVSCPDLGCSFQGPGIKLCEHIGNEHYEAFIKNFNDLFYDQDEYEGFDEPEEVGSDFENNYYGHDVDDWDSDTDTSNWGRT